jgi:membrane-associated phospholipid phosphatase
MDAIILDGGIEIILLIQSLGEWLVPAMAIFTFLGNEEFYLLALGGIYWCLNAKAGLRIALILMISGGINYLFKIGAASPRPYWYDPRVQAWSTESTFGVPSGHAQHAAVLWGWLAGASPLPWGRLGALALIFLIGFSRVYLGVHFPHDVLFGWFIGALLLFGYTQLEKQLGSWLKRLSPWWKVGLAGLAALSVLAAAFAVRASLGEWTLPDVWAETAHAAAPDAHPLDPLNFAGAIAGAGAFFGLASGAVWLGERGGFSAKGTWIERLLRLPLGVVGAGLIVYGPGSLIDQTSTFLTPVLQFLTFSAVGFWVSALAPELFILLKIASRDPAVKQA